MIFKLEIVTNSQTNREKKIKKSRSSFKKPKLHKQNSSKKHSFSGEPSYNMRILRVC